MATPIKSNKIAKRSSVSLSEKTRVGGFKAEVNFNRNILGLSNIKVEAYYGDNKRKGSKK
ncbi:MAG: hypothetical protein M0P71_06150 [Melioribacteraceae bacterium]|nr:hypothetical protein [Melioribacteraceae bacterium]